MDVRGSDLNSREKHGQDYKRATIIPYHPFTKMREDEWT